MDNRATFSSRQAMNIFLGAMALVALLAILIIASNQAQAKTITIKSDNNGKDDLVAGAIASATNGDTIYLTGGIFIEGNLTVNKELTLTSDNLSAMAATSIHVSARNVTFQTISIVLTYDPIFLNGDNWTFDRVIIGDCAGYACVIANHTKGGTMDSTTFVGNGGDALDINDSQDITLNDAYITAIMFGIKADHVQNLSLYNARISQAALGIYLSFCNNVTVEHSVLDSQQYGILAANSTNLTFKGSLLISNLAPMMNYGIYLAFDHKVSIINNTFMADAAGIASYKSTGVSAKWNSIYGNLEGVWAWESEIALTENAIFNNQVYALNVTGLAPSVGNNYWGTTSESDVMKTVRGVTTLQPMRVSDPTPDAVPLLLMPIPNLTNGTEDSASVMLLEVGPYFDDDTWYVQAWNPRPSVVKFTILYLSDPKNVTLRLEEAGTCSGTCKNAEGQLKASTVTNWFGTVTVKIRATDWRGKHVDTNSFTITFNPINDRPALDIQGVPKNSDIKLHNGQSRQLNISVYDDSPNLRIEYKIDNGTWKSISSSASCLNENATKLKGLPLCAKVEFDLTADDSMKVGMHNVSFRTCDDKLCSDDIYSGKYMISLNDAGSPGKSFSPTGVTLALVLLVLIAIVVVAMSSGSSDKTKAKPQQEERPIAKEDDEEE
jgi:nitrous oxidase accessory protein NosD